MDDTSDGAAAASAMATPNVADPGLADGGLAAFNVAATDVLRPQLLACLAVPGWAEGLLAARPYPDRRFLMARATALAAGIDDAELSAALARHPRIGDVPTGTGAEAGWSRAEQSGVDPA